jgi:hypothetical protein
MAMPVFSFAFAMEQIGRRSRNINAYSSRLLTYDNRINYGCQPHAARCWRPVRQNVRHNKME